MAIETVVVYALLLKNSCIFPLSFNLFCILALVIGQGSNRALNISNGSQKLIEFCCLFPDSERAKRCISPPTTESTTSILSLCA